MLLEVQLASDQQASSVGGPSFARMPYVRESSAKSVPDVAYSTVTSVLRFSARPSSVSLEATGSLAP